jgi:hypothetical protein
MHKGVTIIMSHGQHNFRNVLISAACVAVLWDPALQAADSLPPLADVHLHYNGDQEAVVSPKEAIAILEKQNVKLAVVSSTPPELALVLREAGGNWVIPLFRPYFSEYQRHRWFADPTVLPRARNALASRNYKGIGELHLIAGLGPSRKNKTLHGLIQLAIEFDVPLLIHIETSSERYFTPLCKQYPKARFLIAHAGGLLNAKQMSNLLTTCTNVWTEFSARDHMRYVQSPIVNNKGRLLADWNKLIKQYPDRFMIGSDPFWPVEKEIAMEEPDSGWLYVKDYLNFHRKWLAELPEKTRRKLEYDNAVKFFASSDK